MLIHLHSQATTTPKVRAEIQASDEPAKAKPDVGLHHRSKNTCFLRKY